MTTNWNKLAMPLQTFDDDSLLAQYEEELYALAMSRDNAGRVEQEIHRRLEQRNAKAIPSNEFVCELVAQATYSQDGFFPLKEILVKADLDNVLTPAHYPEPVQLPDRWNTVKVLALGRRLPEVQAVVDKAKIEGRPKLVFKRREHE